MATTTIPSVSSDSDGASADFIWTQPELAAIPDGNAASVAFFGLGHTDGLIYIHNPGGAGWERFAGTKIRTITVRLLAAVNILASTGGNLAIRLADLTTGLFDASGILTQTDPSIRTPFLVFDATGNDAAAIAAAAAIVGDGINLYISMSSPATITTGLAAIDDAEIVITYDPVPSGVKDTTVLRNEEYACQKATIPTLTTSAGVAYVTGIGSIVRG